jgi:epoxyqueuosine reductase
MRHDVSDREAGMSTVFERVAAKADERCWKCRAVPWTRMEDLRKAIEDRFEAGLLDEDALRGYLSFIYEPPADLVPRSIIVIAMEALPGHVTFGWRGRKVLAVIPPTYTGFVKRILTAVETLDGWLAPEGFHAIRPRLPMKTLAVCSGLAEYGRNNICYVEGLGSFVQLAAAVTDMPCDADPWRQPKALDRCASCSVCAKRCPTGAIAEERFLLHAEKCITLHNESEDPIPDWIDPSWHNALLGCMRCQEACPENVAVADLHDDLESFTEEETALLLEGTPAGELPRETLAKVSLIDFDGDSYPLLGRNLKLLLEREP